MLDVHATLGSVLHPGDRVGPYELEDELAELTFLARDLRSQRQVTIQVARESTSATNMRERFEREAAVLAELQHENVPQIYEVAEHRGRPYAVFEAVAGESLRARLQTRRRLPVAEALDIAVQVLRALAALHRAGVVFNNLKPDNVIITPDGRVYLIDFAFVSNTNARLDTATTTHVSGYSAPEVVTQQALLPQSDIFSFGVLFYEMIIGQLPFGGRDKIDILNAQIKGKPKLSLLPRYVAPIIRSTFAADPYHRVDIEDLLVALEHLREQYAPTRATRSLDSKHVSRSLASLAITFVTVSLFQGYVVAPGARIFAPALLAALGLTGGIAALVVAFGRLLAKREIPAPASDLLDVFTDVTDDLAAVLPEHINTK